MESVAATLGFILDDNCKEDREGLFETSGDHESEKFQLSSQKLIQSDSDLALSRSYRGVADAALKSLRSDFWINPRCYLPIAYLYRHSVELQLKYVVRLGLETNLLRGTKKLQKHLRSQHQLQRLWGHASHLVEILLPGSVNELSGMNNVIAQLSVLDNLGQSLRYTHNQNGVSNSAALPTFDIERMQQIISKLHLFILVLALELEDEIRIRRSRQVSSRAHGPQAFPS